MSDITLKYDREIVLTVGEKRWSKHWERGGVLLSEFYSALSICRRGSETMAEYSALPKTEQDNKKDVGGFVAGSLSGARRTVSAVTGRELITLDFDNIPSGGTNEVIARVNA